MAVQNKILAYAAERLDLPDYNSLQNFVAEDFGAVMQKMVADQNYVLSGLTVSQIAAPSLNIRIHAPNSVIMKGNDDGTFFAVPSSSSNIDLTLGDGVTTYIWLTLDAITGTNAIRAFWDKTANDGAGAEFNQAVDTVSTWELNVHTSTVSFPGSSADIIHIAVVTTSGGNVTSLVDHRKMLFRLGTGGATNNAGYEYPWTDGRDEPNPDLILDADAFIGGDKQIDTLKNWMDAVMSAIRDIKGSSSWTDEAPSNLSSELYAMTGGGVFSWNSGTGVLAWTDTITFLLPQTAFTNTIATGNLTMSANNQIAYVDIDNTSNAVLTPTVVASSAFVAAPFRLVIARRISDVAYVGID